MANLSFSFNKMKRSFMTVEMKDRRTLVVRMPKKSTFEKLAAIQDMDTDDMNVEDVIDTLGSVIAEFLSNNMAGERITAEEITENYDLEEMNEAITQYMVFTGSLKKDPN